jgi:RimJ/RimL family protein N-acetyltransferase
MDDHEKWLWRDEPGMIDFEMFRQQLRHALAAGEPHLIVEGLNSGRMIGWVYADLLSLLHLRCRMHVYVIPEARIYGAGAEAGILLLDYLFGWLGMHKVFAETLVSQAAIRQMAQHWGFEVEGVLREERWLGWQHHDVARLAIQRKDWHEKLMEATEVTPSYDMPHMRRMLQMNEMFFPDANAPQNL